MTCYIRPAKRCFSCVAGKGPAGVMNMKLVCICKPIGVVVGNSICLWCRHATVHSPSISLCTHWVRRLLLSVFSARSMASLSPVLFCMQEKVLSEHQQLVQQCLEERRALATERAELGSQRQEQELQRKAFHDQSEKVRSVVWS